MAHPCASGDISIPDKGTEVWAQYTNDYYAGSPAVLHRKLGKGSVTYIGVDSKDGRLEKDLLARVFALNNTPVMNLPEGVWVEYRDGFGVAMNYSSENHLFPLPSGARIVIGERTLKPAGVLVWKE